MNLDPACAMCLPNSADAASVHQGHKWSQLCNNHFPSHPCISRKRISRADSHHVGGSFILLCYRDTFSSDHFRDCFYLLAKSEGSKPWSSFGTPTRNKSTCHLHSPSLEVQLRGNWIRTTIQSDLEKLVPNQIDQSINSESTAVESHIPHAVCSLPPARVAGTAEG